MFYIKATGLEPAAHFGGLKAKPQIRQFPQAFVFMPGQIDDGQLTAGAKSAPGLDQRHRRCRYVVQYHARHDGIHFAVSHGQVLKITEAEVATIHIDASRGAGEIQHGRRRIDSDHPVGPFQQGWQQQA